jgi:hypothetical protein
MKGLLHALRARTAKREIVLYVVAVAISLFALGATLKRIRLGVDYTDEAFYIGIPYRFAMGDRPFVDELNIVQTSAFFTYPFVKVYTMIAGTTGIFLFMRVLFVTFMACVGVAAARLASTRVTAPAALLIGTSCVIYLPGSVPALSYNTIGMGLLSIGLFTTTRWLLIRPEGSPHLLRHPLFWSGFALSAAAFAYPPLAVPAVISTITVFGFARGDHVGASRRFVTGALAFVAVISPILITAGPAHLRAMMQYSSAGPEGTASTFDTAKLTVLQNAFIADHPELSLSVGVIAVFIVLCQRWPTIFVLALPLMPWLVWGTPVGPRSGAFLSMRYLGGFGLYAPLLALALRDKRSARVVIFSTWLPSAIGGFLAAWMSGNGATAVMVGLFPAVIATALLHQMWCEETSRRSRIFLSRRLLALAPTVFIGMLIHHEWDNQSIYRDEQLPNLKALVTEGPYKGLYTSTGKQQWLAEFTRDVGARGMGNRALFYYEFPAGYLIANRLPLVPSAWIFQFKKRSELDAVYFNAHASAGELVVFVGSPYGHGGMAMDEAVAARCGPLKVKNGYSYCLVKDLNGARP